jgi:CheY-like chemotaxis protein
MKRVLIVDDAIELGRLLQDILKTVYPDIPVTVVPSAEEALLESTRYTIDLLVTDIRLPGMSGMELIRKIRNRQPYIHVILISGMIMDEALRKQREEIKPDAFLPKPIQPQTFLDAVDRLIGEGRAAAAVEEAEKKTDRLGKTKPRPEKETVLQEMARILPGEPAEPKPPKTVSGMLEETAPQPGETGFAGILSRLRTSLGALTACLLDERGHSVAQAGDLPNMALQEQLAPPLLAAVSSGAKVSYLLGQPISRSVQAYRGNEMDLVLSPVGHYTLLVVLKPSHSSVRLALAFDEALTAQAELFGVMESMGLRIQTAVEAGAPETLLAETEAIKAEEALAVEALETPLGQDQNLEKLEALFVKKDTGQLRMPDADAFWDNASPGDSHDVSSPGVLSFDQAQKLGLFPPEKQE